MGLVPLAEARRFLRLPDHTQDDLLEVCLAGALATIATATARRLEEAEHVEHLDGTATDTLFLSHTPVTAVKSVECRVPVGSNGGLYTLQNLHLLWQYSGEVTTPAPEHVEFDPAGFLIRMDGGSWPAGLRTVSVAYTAGYTAATFPADLRLLALQLTAAMFQRRDKAGVKSERIDDYEIEYASEKDNEGQLYGIPGAGATLARHRRLV